MMRAVYATDGRRKMQLIYTSARGWVGDGKGRMREMAMKDEKWCEGVAKFVS